MLWWVISIIALAALTSFLIVKKRATKIGQITAERSAHKEENIAKIVAYLKNHESITNAEAVKLLGVSPKTAVNYFDELEARGQIIQKGDIGRSVYYKNS